MKAKAILSAITGFFFGLITYFVLRYLEESDPFILAVISGLLFYLLLFPFLVVYGKILNKRYEKFEKEITSPIFYKTNGNFYWAVVISKMVISISVKMELYAFV